ncbi:hypothetical protein [Methylomonas sp. MgM2]
MGMAIGERRYKESIVCPPPDSAGSIRATCLNAQQQTESQIRRQREAVAEMKAMLLEIDSEPARDLLSVVDHMVRRGIRIIGGDG